MKKGRETQRTRYRVSACEVLNGYVQPTVLHAPNPETELERERRRHEASKSVKSRATVISVGGTLLSLHPAVSSDLLPEHVHTKYLYKASITV